LIVCLTDTHSHSYTSIVVTSFHLYQFVVDSTQRQLVAQEGHFHKRHLDVF